MIVHLNGSLTPLSRAAVSPFDRGFLFADGVYEGLRAFGGEIVALPAHIARLRHSLVGARIEGFDPDCLGEMSAELLAANDLADAFVYWQVTRGVTAPRQHLPQAEIEPTIFGYCLAAPPLDRIHEPARMQVKLVRDERWLRSDIKSISLLPVVLAKMAARDADADEAVMVREVSDDPEHGFITEGGSTNVFCVFGTLEKPEIVTPPVSRLMLQGVTRNLLLRVHQGIIERPIQRAELSKAHEVILCGTTTFVACVTHIDGEAVNGGRCGPVTRLLFDEMIQAVRDGTHAQVVYRT
jgi:D-alanine transaminase